MARQARKQTAIDVGGAEPSYADVALAAERLHGVAHRTPVITSRSIDGRAGSRVYLKCENFQRVGAFKFRGAYNRIVQLGPHERSRGVVAYSSGNHAQGVALAAQILGVRATIVMPYDAPAPKRAATEAYGAEVLTYDRQRQDRRVIGERVALDRGATLVPPYDDRAIIAGQGTAALELFEEIPDLDVLLVPVGGGGLLAGCALAASELCRDLEVYGVEPAAGDDFARSFALGRRVNISVPDTIADGQQTTSPGRLTFPIVRRLCAGFVTVSDDEIRTAMRFAFERLKLVLEPSGASALAAIVGGAFRRKRCRIGIILSGGNVDRVRYAEILADAGAAPKPSRNRAV